MTTTVTAQTLPEYVEHLRVLLKKQSKIELSEWIDENDDDTIDFTWSMQECLNDLRSRMRHDH